MDTSITTLKRELQSLTLDRKSYFEKISDYIFQHPELAYHEYKAQEILCAALESNGFDVTKGVGGIETSFTAVYTHETPGKTIAFMAEYDALPEIGHACGHNIIATSSVGAGIVLKALMEKYALAGTLKVIGTPAEERGGGKVQMLREGIFDGLDAAMIMHPTEATIPDDISFASVNMEYAFHGKAAHAAAYPWKGSSALSAVIQMFNAVDAARLHLKDYTRVHGIIPDGGTAHNTIPEKATTLFNIRALDFTYLEEIVMRIERCAQGAALCTGTTVEIRQKGEMLKNVKNNKHLVDIFRANMRWIREPYIERTLDQGIGSTDVGNVTHALPAIQAYIGLKKGIGTHTVEFADASGGPEGKAALGKAIQILSMSGLDVLQDSMDYRSSTIG